MVLIYLSLDLSIVFRSRKFIGFRSFYVRLTIALGAWVLQSSFCANVLTWAPHRPSAVRPVARNCTSGPVWLQLQRLWAVVEGNVHGTISNRSMLHYSRIRMNKDPSREESSYG